MPRRGQQPTHEVRRISIEQTAASFEHSDHASSSNSIEILASLEPPVLSATKVAITILSSESSKVTSAVAFGVTAGVWRIVATFRDREFSTLLTMLANRMLAFGEISSEPIRRERGHLNHIGFSSTRIE